MPEYKQREFWSPDSEGVPLQGGVYRREFDIQRFFDIMDKDERFGDIVGLKFDGKNVEIFTKVPEEQLKKMLEEKNNSTK